LHGDFAGELGSPAHCEEVMLFLDLVVLGKVSAGFGTTGSGKSTLIGIAAPGEESKRRRNWNRPCRITQTGGRSTGSPINRRPSVSF
jgi:hypothetical protein